MRNHRSSPSLWVASLLMACVCTHALAYDEREKTDVISMRNGDRITGEIISLEYGILTLKTSNLGTVKVEWPAVQSIESRYQFYVERIGALRLYGNVASLPAGAELRVDDGSSTTTLPFAEVTRMSQVDSDFWKRIDGTLAVGYNFAKSSDISVTSLEFDANYRSKNTVSTLAVSSFSTKSPDSGTSDRDQIAGTMSFLRPNRNYWLGLASLERNEELGIEGRAQVGVAFGHQFLQRQDTELNGYAGLSFNQEWLTGTEGGQQSLEAVLGGDWRIFRFSDPETALNASLMLYPSLTESGRYRAELNTSLSRDLIEDLTLGISVYGSYDSDPPESSFSGFDYGVVTSLGYKF